MILSAIFPAINLVRNLAVSSSVFGLWNVICKTCPCFNVHLSSYWTGKFYESNERDMFEIVGQVSPRSLNFCGEEEIF
jgi:hypothetical protein